MKIYILVLCLSFPCLASSQDTVWNPLKVDENLQISLPGKLVTLDTVVTQKSQRIRLKVLHAVLGQNNIVLSVTPEATHINADNPESLNEAMTGVKEGFRNSMAKKGFTCIYKDTIIDKLTCVKGLTYKDSIETPAMRCYIFLVNDKLYTLLLTIPRQNSLLKKDIDYILNSVNFNQTAIKEQRFASKAGSAGYRIGYLIGYLAAFVSVVAGVFALAYYITKNKIASKKIYD